MEFEFYGLVSHKVVSALCYWILSEKGKVLLCTTVHNLNSEKLRDANVQEYIRDYHGLLEYALGSDKFGTSFDSYKSFIYDDEEDTTKGKPNGWGGGVGGGVTRTTR